MAPDAAPLDLLRRESRSLVQRLRLWTPARSPRRPRRAGGAGTRGDLVHHLAQALADRAADLEGRPASAAAPARQRPGPGRPAGGDRRRPGPLRRPADAGRGRGDRPPAGAPGRPARRRGAPGLAASLGLADVLGAGRAECRQQHGGRSPAGDRPPSGVREGLAEALDHHRHAHAAADAHRLDAERLVGASAGR